MQLAKQAEIVQVTVIKFCLIIPFNLNSNTVFEVVDFMRGTGDFVAIDNDFRVKFLLLPTAFREKAIEFGRYW